MHLSNVWDVSQATIIVGVMPSQQMKTPKGRASGWSVLILLGLVFVSTIIPFFFIMSP